MRRLLAGCLLAACLVGGPAVATESDPLAELRVSSSQRVVEGSPGSRCRTHLDANGNGTGGCADYRYPLEPRGRLPLRPGKVLAFDFGAPVDRLDATYIARGEERRLAVRPQGEPPSARWLAEVPRDVVPGGLLLSVLAFYDPPANPSGDQHWQVTTWVLRPLRTTGSTRVPRVRGGMLPAAKRALERRGLRWRVDGGGPESDSGPVVDGSPATVRTQRPRPGRRVARDSVVRLTTR